MRPHVVAQIARAASRYRPGKTVWHLTSNARDMADAVRYCAVVEVAKLEAMLEAWRTGDTSGLYVMFVGVLENVDCDAALASLPEDARGHLVERLQERDGELAMVIADASPRASARIRAWNDTRNLNVYESVIPYVDREDLHEVLAARGPDFLGEDIPYIIQACRWKQLDRLRRRSRESVFYAEEKVLGIVGDDVMARVETAFEVMVADTRLRQLRSALAQLSNVDIHIVWKTAEGDDDHTIARRLHVSVDVVRQRRSRAIGRLRELVRKSE
jgi:DNA-binding CsgD family transcriptional regulator